MHAYAYTSFAVNAGLRFFLIIQKNGSRAMFAFFLMRIYTNHSLSSPWIKATLPVITFVVSLYRILPAKTRKNT